MNRMQRLAGPLAVPVVLVTGLATPAAAMAGGGGMQIVPTVRPAGKDAYDCVYNRPAATCADCSDGGGVETGTCHLWTHRYKREPSTGFIVNTFTDECWTTQRSRFNRPERYLHETWSGNKCTRFEISREGEISTNDPSLGRLCLDFDAQRGGVVFKACTGGREQQFVLRIVQERGIKPSDPAHAAHFVGIGRGLAWTSGGLAKHQGYDEQRCLQECLANEACNVATVDGGLCRLDRGVPEWFSLQPNTPASTIFVRWSALPDEIQIDNNVVPTRILGTKPAGGAAGGTPGSSAAAAPPPDPNLKDASGNTALHRAVGDKLSPDELSGLIDGGASVDVANNQGETALFVAVDKNDVDTVRYLLDAGAGVNWTNSSGQNALTKAVKAGNRREIVDLLLERGATPSQDVINKAFETRDDTFIDNVIRAGAKPVEFLTLAVDASDMKLTKRMLTKGAKPTDAHVQKSVRDWNSEMLGLLLSYGGNADAALATAMAGDPNLVITRMTLQHGAKPDPHMARAAEIASLPLIDLLVEGGGDPNLGMMKAIETKAKPVVLNLMGHGATIHQPEYVEYWVVRGDVDMTRFVLEQGGDAEKAVRSALAQRQSKVLALAYDITPVKATVEHLELALGGHNVAVVSVVLDQGVNPQLGMNKAIEVNDGHLVTLLVERGADPKPKELIVTAVKTEKAAAAATLASLGARVDWTIDEAGTTLLHYAVGHCSTTTDTLLYHKADVNKPDPSGNTPLHIVAAGKGCKDILERLLTYGADVNAKDSQGRTPLAVVRGMNKKRKLKKAGGT